MLIAAVCVLSLICFNKYVKNAVDPRIPKLAFLCGSFFVMALIATRRVNIGYDYQMYARGFWRLGIDGFPSGGDILNAVADRTKNLFLKGDVIGIFRGYYLDWEWGFILLTKTVVFFTRNIHVYMGIVSAVCLAGPFYLIYRYSKNVWMSVLLYVNLYFFYCTMNFMRQSIAISIVLFAYTFLMNRKFIPYCLLILAAALFHSTVLIMLPAYFLIKFKPSLRIPLVYAFFIMWVFISSNAALELLLGNIFTKYVHYLDTSFLAEGIDLIHIVVPALIIITGIYFTVKFAKTANDTNKTFFIQTNLMYFSFFWLSVMLRHSILERVSYYSYVLVILYVPELIAFIDVRYKDYLNKKYNILVRRGKLTGDEQKSLILKYKNRRKIVSGAVTAAVVIITVSYNIFGLVAYDRGVHGIYPYQTWA